MSPRRTRSQPSSDPAALSNAGDEFHVLWAARRCLRLLDPRGDLKAVRMERVAQNDALTEADDLMLGVDLAEYWGGPDFEHARLVEISQLKYSTQHPERVWTAARLAKKPSPNRASPIRRLAEIFKSYSVNDRQILVDRLRIRLVSNQAVDDTLLSTLGHASSIPVTEPSSLAALRLGMTAAEQAELEKLHAASGLGSQAFADFVRLLDVRDCGAEPRALQGIRLQQEASPFLGHGRTAGTTGLVALVAAQAQPDRLGQPLTAGVVRAALGIIDEVDLFPAPAKFRLPDRLVTTDTATALAAAVRAASGPLLVHGGAGSGKTTTVLALGDAIPEAAVVAFDTFGNGEYDDERRDRHSPSAVLPQLANELATMGLSDFLTVAPAERFRAWALFERHLEEAAASLEREGRLLVIVIDAADNGAVVAEKRSEPSVFPGFWKMALPANARLVVTCRTHRRALLAPPSSVAQFEVQGFDERESASYLRWRYPGATDDQCAEFHAASGGNPRVQSYSLDVVSTGEASIRATLEAAHKSPTTMFDDLFGSAHEVSRQHAHEWILSLMCLTRPIEVAEYARVWGTPDHDAADFLTALSPGVLVNDGEITFRDEDFDTYLRDRFTRSEVADGHGHLADHYQGRADRDETAASVLARHLAGAGRVEELVDLAMQPIAQETAPDPLRRAQIRLDRIERALEALPRAASDPRVPRLLVLAAGTSQSNAALAGLIRRDPGLAARFLDPEAVAEIYLRSDSEAWAGARFLQTAAALGRDEQTKLAAMDARTDAETWIRAKVMMGDRSDWRLDADDLAAGVEAVYLMEGAAAAWEWLRRWRPVGMYFTVAQHLATRLASYASPSRVANDLLDAGVDPVAAAPFAAAFGRLGKPVGAPLLAPALEFLATRRGRRLRFETAEWVADLAEAALEARVAPDLIETLADRAPLPRTPVHDWDGGADWLAALRVAVAVAQAHESTPPTVEELMTNLPPEKPYGGYERGQTREWLQLMEPLVTLRAKTLCGVADVEAVRALVLEASDTLRGTAGHRWYRAERRYRWWPILASSAISRLPGARDLTSAVADLVPSLLGPWAAETWTAMAQPFAAQPAFEVQARQLLERAARSVVDAALPASERAELLLACAERATSFDSTLAAEFFRLAAGAAQGIDDDRALLLGAASRLATHADDQGPRAIAVALRDCLDAIRPFVSESRVLPTEDVLEALARLDPVVALSAASVWADEDDISLGLGIGTVASYWIAHGPVPGGDAFEMLALAARYGALGTNGRALLDASERQGGSSHAEMAVVCARVCRSILVRVPLDSRARAAREVVGWAEKHNRTDLPGVADLIRFLDFAATLPPSSEDARKSSLDFADDDEPTAPCPDLDAVGPTFDGLQRELEKLLGQRDTSSRLRNCFESLIAACPSAVRLNFLDAVGRMWAGDDQHDLYVGALVDALASALEHWGYLPVVEDWARRGTPQFLAGHLRALLRWGPYETDDFEKAKKLPGLEGRSIATALLEGIVGRRGAWRPAQYVAVAEAIAETFGPEERNQFALWVVTSLVGELPSRVPAMHPSALPCDLDEALAGFFVAVWGFRDKRDRGAAVHAALGLVARRGAGLVGKLVEELGEPHAPAFRSTRLQPLQQSSRLWLLFALAHVGATNPSLLEPYADRLAGLALSHEYPHAQGRELAKRAALFAEASRPGLLPADVVDRLHRLNQPISKIRVANAQRRENPRRRDKSLRFSFDEMDVLPYWYEPLADVFDVSTTDVAQRADRWIVDQWRYTDDDWWKDIRELRERDSRETMADHGSYPRYEILRTYLEFHAMQMAAGELIDTHPVAAPRWTDDDDRWDDWLARWMDSDPNMLIADLRSPTPLVAPFFGRIESAADRRLSDDYFDQFVGFSERSPSTIVVGGTANVARPDEHQSVTIASALVAPAKGMALVSALETADAPISWALPVTGSGPWANDEIRHPSYNLEAWLEIEKRYTRALEEHDPFAEGVEYEIWRPRFIARASGVPASILVRDAERAPAWLEIWSDPTDNDDVVHGEGVRLWVRLEPLRQMLRRRNRALILSITIHGYRPGRRGREDRLVPDQTHLYLLSADGRLRTLGGDRFLGQTDREGARSGGEDRG